MAKLSLSEVTFTFSLVWPFHLWFFSPRLFIFTILLRHLKNRSWKASSGGKLVVMLTPFISPMFLFTTFMHSAILLWLEVGVITIPPVISSRNHGNDLRQFEQLGWHRDCDAKARRIVERRIFVLKFVFIWLLWRYHRQLRRRYKLDHGGVRTYWRK